MPKQNKAAANADGAKLDAAIAANLEGLGYGG
jgi:hypothetical protein